MGGPERHRHSRPGRKIRGQHQLRYVPIIGYTFLAAPVTDSIFRAAVPTSEALNSAVDALTELGVLVVAGAGNDGKDASARSPASKSSWVVNSYFG